MKDEQTDLLQGDDHVVDDQKLMDYINDLLSVEEKIEVDLLVQKSDFLKEAVSGLKQFQESANLPVFVHQLNDALHKQLLKPAQRRRKRKIRNELWIYIAVFIILLLITAGFFIIKERLGR